jgi:hypothetical protein
VTTQRKAQSASPLLYSGSQAVDWVRTLTQFIDESLAALAVRQWQRAPITVMQSAPAQRRFR